MSLQTRLRETRELAGVSAHELSDLSGASPAYVGHIESGRRKNPGSDRLDGIARALGTSVEYLLRGKGPEPTAESVEVAIEAARRARKRRQRGAAA